MNDQNYKPLENIEERVRQVLNQLGIKIEKPVKQAIKNRKNFYILFTDHQNERVVFKARLADHRVLKQWGKSFQNERRFYKALSTEKPKINLAERIPTLIATQSNRLDWLIYKCIKKKPVGPDCCHSIYLKDLETQAVLDLIVEIQNFPLKQFLEKHDWAQKNIKRHDFFAYRQYFNRITKAVGQDILPLFNQNLLNKAARIILSERDTLNRNATLLSHGDFTPANIFVDGQAMAIDWETLHIDNAAHDISTLWFRTGEHLEWRRSFLAQVKKKTRQQNDFAQLFRLNILARMPGELAIWIKEAKKWPPDSPEYIQAQKLIAVCYSNYISAIKNDPLEEYA